MLFNTHLCNHYTTPKWWWDLGHISVHTLYNVRGVGTGVGMSTLDAQTSLYAEDRGDPSTDGPGSCIHSEDCIISELDPQ